MTLHDALSIRATSIEEHAAMVARIFDVPEDKARAALEAFAQPVQGHEHERAYRHALQLRAALA